MFQKAKQFAVNAARKLQSGAMALAGVIGLSLVGAEQHASAAIDVTSTVTAITDSLTPIGLIGGAVLTVLVGVKTYKWVRRAM